MYFSLYIVLFYLHHFIVWYMFYHTLGYDILHVLILYCTLSAMTKIKVKMFNQSISVSFYHSLLGWYLMIYSDIFSKWLKLSKLNSIWNISSICALWVYIIISFSIAMKISLGFVIHLFEDVLEGTSRVRECGWRYQMEIFSALNNKDAVHLRRHRAQFVVN